LDDQSRQLERYVTGPDLKEIVAGEFNNSARFGGRSVFGWEPPAGEDEALAKTSQSKSIGIQKG
jgi:hypothetical protein